MLKFEERLQISILAPFRLRHREAVAARHGTTDTMGPRNGWGGMPAGLEYTRVGLTTAPPIYTDSKPTWFASVRRTAFDALNRKSAKSNLKCLFFQISTIGSHCLPAIR